MPAVWEMLYRVSIPLILYPPDLLSYILQTCPHLALNPEFKGFSCGFWEPSAFTAMSLVSLEFYFYLPTINLTLMDILQRRGKQKGKAHLAASSRLPTTPMNENPTSKGMPVVICEPFSRISQAHSMTSSALLCQAFFQILLGTWGRALRILKQFTA